VARILELMLTLQEGNRDDARSLRGLFGFLDRIDRGDLERGNDLAAHDRAFAIELEAALVASSLTERQVMRIWRHYLRIVHGKGCSRGVAAAASPSDEAAGIKDVINRLRGRFRSERYRGADR
jgi:hypothetical protein